MKNTLMSYLLEVEFASFEYDYHQLVGSIYSPSCEAIAKLSWASCLIIVFKTSKSSYIECFSTSHQD